MLVADLANMSMISPPICAESRFHQLPCWNVLDPRGRPQQDLVCNHTSKNHDRVEKIFYLVYYYNNQHRDGRERSHILDSMFTCAEGVANRLAGNVLVA